jgi:hypothetical protein
VFIVFSMEDQAFNLLGFAFEGIGTGTSSLQYFLISSDLADYSVGSEVHLISIQGAAPMGSKGNGRAS